jgi:Tol biopolymer transport system component
VQAELERILASEIFSRSDRLSAFLKFIVDQTLNGQGDSLKEQVIAEALYGKGADFSTAADPIVRVDARRLRDKLREYYASATEDPVLISVPKGSYTPAFERHRVDVDGSRGDATGINDAQAAAAAVPESPRDGAPQRLAGTNASRWWRIAGVAIALIGLSVWLVANLRNGDRSESAMRVLTVTSFPGAEEDPSLSPDGNFVAFRWSRLIPGVHSYIWVKAVEGESLRRLTEVTDGSERYPEWSPDGRSIAFSRIVNGRSSVHTISALGGLEQLITDQGSSPTWLPDSRSLVMIRCTRDVTPDSHCGLVHQVLETGERRQLTQAPDGFTDQHPKVSPDGRTLAFERTGSGRSGLFVMPMTGGAPTQIGDWSSGFMGGLSWTPDSREILFPRPEMSGRRLFRVAASGREPAVAVPGVPLESISPSASHVRSAEGYRLAFVSGQPDVGIRLIDLQTPRQGATITADTPFCDATRMDTPGRFSPDGTQVAFTSDRSGSPQVWIAGRDGSGLRSVTDLRDATVNVGSWSPDGRWVAFDAAMGGNRDVYVVRSDGGPLTRLTHDTGAESDPEWSRDGHWIYYTSNESGRSEIWKMHADGGGRVKLTSEGGFEPRESPDGQTVYFINGERAYGLGPPGTLERIPAAGGAASVVQSGINPGAWESTEIGILFLIANVGPEPETLAVYDVDTHQVRRLGELAFRVAPWGVHRFLIASRDGRWVLAAHIDGWERDIFVVDEFR